jgi:hypothetical protein
MMARLIALLLLAVMVLAANACRKNVAAAGQPSAKPPAVASAGQPLVSLPSSWPLPEIAPPAGSLRAPRCYSVAPGYGNDYIATGSPFNQGSENAGKLWSVGFGYRGGWEQARRHFDASMPEGWKLYYDKPSTREYISPDSRYIAQLYYNGEMNSFMLSIFVYDEVLSGTNVSGV